MPLPLKDFKNKNADFLLDQCFETTKIYFGHNLTHSELNSEVYKNGKVAFLNLKLYLNDATTMEQDILNSFVKKNKYPNTSSLYVNRFGKVYKLWGHVTYETKRPFILMNVNNVNDQFLVDDDFVRKFFHNNTSTG